MIKNKKTGKIIDGCVVVCEYKDGARFSVNDKPVFDSLSTLNEEWEDVKEPLIKDEKVRKALRAWYELFDENQLGEFKNDKYIAVDYCEFLLQHQDKSLTYTLSLPFIDDKQSLSQRLGLGSEVFYTITELCGSEE